MDKTKEELKEEQNRRKKIRELKESYLHIEEKEESNKSLTKNK